MILFISSHPPFAKQQNKELLDMVLAAGAFDLNCALLIQGDAVLQLRAQNSKLIEQKDINKSLSALPLYGIETIYVFEQDLAKFQIGLDEINLDIKVLPNDKKAILLQTASKVIRL
ncbi:DsrE family protein [Marinicellulosiphila megalodicopiae]|uniref:DsrE family protein n=1 Tax=Marinicellulosiphila megalodicopiae TaxID=2724896 RepID=UPI003BB08E3C